MIVRSALLNVMMAAARKAGRGMLRDFGEVEKLQVSMKGTADFVSSADLKAEKTLRQELAKARPGYAFLLEEGGEVAGEDKSHRWIVDPIDGTTNFLHGIPHFAVSVGLERDGEMVAGVVYEPISDSMFHAEKGAGAFLNDWRLRVSARRKMDESVITTGIPHRGRPGQEVFIKELTAVMTNAAGVRRFGSAALDLAYVAAGRCEGYWEHSIKPWDMAAGIVLVREAGGYVTDFEGKGDMLASGDVVAANDQLHAPLLSLLRRAAN
ncbi:inositol monophosphatase family protein [Magnetospirillum sp. UT-4]|uniref:inositol monophosphatase family protein n=1 Tax=Magnetospirillum sp. UT-4 TaxID=2681467 RepID=UPI001384FD17|nr:inositol monophosphatase family protein [Magnetospirillum sp. UT-4]CAA7620339.1 Inositol-1-monophosphatase [Magnetospirillum sp. UT-4]